MNEKLTREQAKIVIGTFLGWTVDAFDFFILIFVLSDVAKEFSVSLVVVTGSIIVTLIMRFFGAILFGPIGDKYGRRIVMIVTITFLAVFDFLVAFSPTITIFLVLRGLYGLGMGGEWSSGAALVMESIPSRSRGWVSGLLQAGYPMGYLFAALDFFFVFPTYGWRAMFYAAIIPALLVIYIRFGMKESPVFDHYKERASIKNTFSQLKKHYKLAIYLIILLTGMSFVSHGTQDLYPTFLKTALNFSPKTITIIAIAYNIAAIFGGIIAGIISQNTRLGRKWTAISFSLAGAAITPIWAFPQIFGQSMVLEVAFIAPILMQFVVQGAWAMPGVYMNERSPAEARATISGLAYMTGIAIASTAATIQVLLVSYFHGNYSYSLFTLALIVLLGTSLIWSRGKESKNASLDVEKKLDKL